MKGLTVSVYKDVDSNYDCTAGGVTSKQTRFVLVDDSIQAPFEVKEDEVYMVLVRRVFGSGNGSYVHAEPRRNGKPLIKEGYYGMMGGNFIYTSDSRFPNSYPIPVHDRFESPECFEAMSH